MRISIDVSAAVNGKAGLGRYAASLAAALAQQQRDLHLFANLAREAAWPPSLDDLPRTTIRAGYKAWRMAVLLGQFGTLGWDRFLPRPAVFHAAEHLLMPLRRTPTVLTVHDLIFKLFPEHHKRLNYTYLNLAMPLYVRRADRIIAVSEATRRDLGAHYGVPPEKVTVVYEAAAEHFRPQPSEEIERVRAAYDLPPRYLITVGTIEPRKNHSRLVEALAVLRQTDPELNLIVVGAEGWLTEGFHAALRDHNQGEAVLRLGYVPDSDLPAMLAGATAAVLPSLYEGFGLPVLEAMACGVPVACSRTSSVGEIAGEAALTFHPEDIDEMIHTLRTLLSDEALRDDLRERGFARAAEFSWARAARETWRVYQQAAAR